jgi:hypothetical protein
MGTRQSDRAAIRARLGVCRGGAEAAAVGAGRGRPTHSPNVHGEEGRAG